MADDSCGDASKFDIRVAGLNGHLCSVQLDRTQSVLDVKTAISETVGVPCAEQRILYEDTELQDGELVCNYLRAATNKMELTLLRCPAVGEAERDEWSSRLRADGMDLMFASDEVQADRKLVMEAVLQSGVALALAAEELRCDREIVLHAVRSDGLALAHASSELREDLDLVLIAVQQNGRALSHASRKLRTNREVVLAAVKQCGYVFADAVMEVSFREDYNIALAAVEYDGCLLKDVSKHLRGNRAIVLSAVRSNGNAIQWATPNFRNDHEVMKMAVCYHGTLLRCASEELRDNRELVLLAVLQHGYALSYASAALKADTELVQLACRPNCHWPVRLENGKVVIVGDDD